MQEQTIKPTIRVATVADAQELLDIYAPYVTDTAISFEYDVPSLTEFEARITNILKKYPYLVAEYDGEILGYAYTHAFVGRAAYDHAVETTIYLKEDKTKMGIGRMLYEALEKISQSQNILNLNACIGYPEVPDEHLNLNSVQFHEHMGYQIVGTFHNCGYKFGTWYHMVWMEKIIGNHDSMPLPVIPFPELNPENIVHLLHFST
ncbi:MAG: GNAT family N-acetyltransferase [Lachnospiraceae bacterium]|nr:GNAT family N-acetyltransferase [Lachnospiraceae bacterium]